MSAWFSPAKINLYLAVTGRRADGFHDLVSVVATLDFGDQLEVVPAGRDGSGRFRLECDEPSVPLDGTNLVLRAAEAFVKETGWSGSADFRLAKRIPVGAGLGGGSSNAVAALRALNALAGGPLDDARLEKLAGGLGSDCVLFLRNGPVVMRGRGERTEVLPAGAAARLTGRRVLLFKPSFGVGTAWAYGRMAERSADYLPAGVAEARLAEWTGGDAPAEGLVFNNMQPAVFEKYVALPVLLKKVRETGVTAGMSGSGSACFALPRGEAEAAALTGLVRESWGGEAFVREARIVQFRIDRF